MARRKNLLNETNIQITLTSLPQDFSLGKNHVRSHLERAGGTINPIYRDDGSIETENGRNFPTLTAAKELAKQY